MRLSILQILNRPALTGGMENYVFNLSLKLREKGHRVVLALKKGTDFFDEAARNGFEIIPITRGGALQPYNIYSIFRALRRTGFDILHAHTGNDYWPPLIAKWIAGKSGARVFVTRHVLSPPKGFSTRFYFQHVDTICVSNAVLEVMKKFSSEGSRLHMVYPGIDTARFSPGNGTPSYRGPEPGFVVGTMHKWFSRCVRIIGRALAEMPDVRFVVAGDLKPDELKSISQIDASGRVRTLGLIRNMPDFYRSVDAFMFPSFDEAFGMVVAEALAMGVPAVSASTGGAAEIYRDGECGFLVDASDAGGYVSALKKIAGDRALYERLSSNAKAVGASFGLERMASAIESIYLNSIQTR